MSKQPPITVEASGAFVDTSTLQPTGQGPLSGVRFAIKDLIDVAGRKSGCGNPTWRDTHPPATVHAVCVEQLLAAGAAAVGKTVTDELAFSLIGANHFYGTPLNPAAPDRVPGGSSSGSASAVACGLADFALGTDTGGSVRVPASNCGIWGLRPSHGVVSLAGVMPFAPTFDTVGVLAASAEILERAMLVLLADEPAQPAEPPAIYLLDEPFALAEPQVRDALAGPIERLRKLFGDRVRGKSLAEIVGQADAELDTWRDVYCVLQWAEVESSLGAWIADNRPEFGPATAISFDLVRNLDRRRVAEATARREAYCRRLRTALANGALLCLPTAPSPAPLKAGPAGDRRGPYYRRALSLTSIAGIGRLPQISMPLGQTPEGPIGLSLVGGWGSDAELLAAGREIS